MKVVFATHNDGKLIEMRAILAGLPIEVVSADEAGVTEEVAEDGVTFEENALKKARFVAEKTGEWALADDSGLCIDSLGGAPGVRSARWAQDEGVSDNVTCALQKLAGLLPGERGAWFETAAVLVAPDGRHWMFTGRINGSIADAPRGTPRPTLPYDTIFIPKGYSRTFAEMSDEEKNGMSHRGEAFRKLKEVIDKFAFPD